MDRMHKRLRTGVGSEAVCSDVGDIGSSEVGNGGHAVPGLEWTSLLRRTVASRENRGIDGPTEIRAFLRTHMADSAEPRWMASPQRGLNYAH